MRRTKWLLVLSKFVDVGVAPFAVLAAIWFAAVRKFGVRHLPVTWAVLRAVRVFPIRDQYYEPLVNPRHLRKELSEPRSLPGIDMNAEEQLSILRQFSYQEELLQFPMTKRRDLEFYYNNDSFMSGDAEYFYSLVRLVKPRRVIEVGCGFSTLVALAALERNSRDDVQYKYEMTCIEPYEQPWLERLGVKVVRRRVEECGLDAFRELSAGDILFIDSSHVIRPQGDVLYEMLEILPSLKSGVYVHVHDIFTPRDYLPEWILRDVKLWNEQYLLEAFLCFNRSFRVIGAVNFLKHQYHEDLGEKLPVLKSELRKREPGSFWMVRQ